MRLTAVAVEAVFEANRICFVAPFTQPPVKYASTTPPPPPGRCIFCSRVGMVVAPPPFRPGVLSNNCCSFVRTFGPMK
jgi:hypothetical protein